MDIQIEFSLITFR